MRRRSAIRLLLPLIAAATVATPSAGATGTAPAVPAVRTRTCTWSDVSSPFFQGQLLGVTAFSDSNAWTVGYATGGELLNQAIVERWNGRRWKVVDSPQPGSYRDFLEKIEGASPTDIWAVGGYQNRHGQGLYHQHTLVEHWDGTRWRVVHSPNLPASDDTLFGVTVVATDDVWAAGSASRSDGSIDSLIEHWDGTAWSIVPSRNPGTTTNVLGSIDALSPTNIWTMGSFANGRLGLPHTLAEHWSGARWKVVATPNIGALGDALEGVAAIAPDDVWAAGVYAYHTQDGSEATATMTQHWDGTSWTLVSTPDPPGGDNQLHGITALAHDQVWAVGTSVGGPVILRWDGQAWSTERAPGSSARWLWSVVALSPTDLWSVGSHALDFLIMRAC